MQSDCSTTEVVYKSLRFLGFPKYKVGDDGSVWSRSYGDWRKLVPCSDSQGYVVHVLCHNGTRKTYKAHTLVLLAFVGPKPRPNMECRHYPDPDKTNNHLNNVSWGSEKENQNDRVEHDTHNRGESNYSAKVTEDVVVKMRKMFDSGKYASKELQGIFNLSKSQVNKIVNRKVWTHV